VTGPDEMAYNEPVQEPVVKFTEKPVTGIQDTLEVIPVSATIFSIPVNIRGLPELKS